VGAPTPLARYQAAHAALAGGEYARALAALDALPADFVLADYADYFAAEALLRAGDAAAALERLLSFADRHPDSVLAPAALLAAADAALRVERWADGLEAGRRFLARAPGHPEAGRLLVRMAQAQAALGEGAEAAAALRRRWIEAPATTWGQVARDLLEDLAGRGVPVPPLTGEEVLRQAQRLAESGEPTAAARLLEGLLAQAPEPELRHRALLRLAPVLGRLRRGAEAIEALRAAVDGSPTAARPALLAELARLQLRSLQAAAGAVTLERLVADHPDAGEVPDAWLALARARLDLGQPASARAALHQLLQAHPDSGAAAAGRWELAWLEYRDGRHREAALGFRQASAATGSLRAAGLYWAGRALEALGERPMALALYRDTASRVPNGYYGILAARRLAGRPPAPLAAPIRLAADPLAPIGGDPHYRRAEALRSAGFEGHALGELEALGREGILDPERGWALGVVYARLGDVGRSLRHLRRSLGVAAEAGTPGLRPDFWRLYYPVGYDALVREAAQRADLDPFFVAAVIREESSYDPRARSAVGAVGLMQLMPETARDLAAEARVAYAAPAALWEPPVNIALGAHYLGRLRARFQEPLLVAAGYNAGPQRVQRWLQERRIDDLEEWVDQIPFDETRGFVKRVATSWHHYRRLYAGGPGPRRPGEAEAAPRPRRR
jgi:soluble lytic murein transglycosylase